MGGPTGRGKIWGSWWIPALRSPFREGAKVRDNVTGAMIKGDYSHWDTSLRRPLTVWPEEIKVPAAQPLPDTPVISKVGTLSNQLRIVSFNRKSTLASVGLYLPAGSRYDHPHFLGTTHFLKHMAFQVCLKHKFLHISVSGSKCSAETFIWFSCCFYWFIL